MARLWFSFLSRTTFNSEGVNPAWLLTTQSIARENTEDSPYLVPNEWICGHIAGFLRLPIPPFALMRRNRSRKGMFASLSFATGDIPPDDCRPGVCAKLQPRWCSGILLFDILVANSDRHRGNIKVDDPMDPKEIRIFDHDRALFGTFKKDGRRRLRDLRDRLGITSGTVTGGNRHCLLDHLRTESHFPEWARRISDIPRWFIEDVCRAVVSLGIDAEEAEAAIDFLCYRAQHLRKIVFDNRDEFTAVGDWGLFL